MSTKVPAVGSLCLFIRHGIGAVCTQAWVNPSLGPRILDRLAGGEMAEHALAAVMRDEPDWSALPQGLSPRWRALLRRCLTKDPRQRLQSIGEARIALEDLASNPHEPAASATAATFLALNMPPGLVV